jgi:chromosome segregation ATPase
LEEIKALFNAIIERLDVQNVHIEQMKMDIAHLKGDMKQVKEDVAVLKRRCSRVEGRRSSIKRRCSCVKTRRFQPQRWTSTLGENT